MFDSSMEIKTELNRDRLMEQAVAHRLRRSAQPPPGNLQKRLLLRAGDILITFGSKLKAWGQASAATPLLRTS